MREDEAVTTQPVSHVEIERKFSLSGTGGRPDLDGWPGVDTVCGERSFFLDATYFDTEDLRLARRGITLRRRLGGTDAGWHLKLPQGADAREEIRLPLDASTGDGPVPPELSDRVRDVVGDRHIGRVCRVGTHRTEWDLKSGGRVLATTCDDQVSVANLIDPGQDREWHEMEVELVDGDVAFLDAVTAHLAEYGVQQATFSSKLREAMGTAIDREQG